MESWVGLAAGGRACQWPVEFAGLAGRRPPVHRRPSTTGHGPRAMGPGAWGLDKPAAAAAAAACRAAGGAHRSHSTGRAVECKSWPKGALPDRESLWVAVGPGGARQPYPVRPGDLVASANEHRCIHSTWDGIMPSDDASNRPTIIHPPPPHLLHCGTRPPQRRQRLRGRIGIRSRKDTTTSSSRSVVLHTCPRASRRRASWRCGIRRRRAKQVNRWTRHVRTATRRWTRNGNGDLVPAFWGLWVPK